MFGNVHYWLVGLLILSHMAAMADVGSQTDIPQGCRVWFDGCNTCIVGRDETDTEQQVLACTKKYCPPEALTTPGCREYYAENE